MMKTAGSAKNEATSVVGVTGTTLVLTLALLLVLISDIGGIQA